MPVTVQLPEGTFATALPGDADSLLGGTRITAFRYDLLDRSEGYLGQLDTVADGGSLSWSAQASIKSGGTIPVRSHQRSARRLRELSVRSQFWRTCPVSP